MTAAVQVQPQDWRELAACSGADPEIFFPTPAAGPAYAAQVAEAKAICGRCSVRQQCLAFAMDVLGHGVAGGLTAEERHALRTSGGPSQRRAAGLAEWRTSRERAMAGRAALRAGRSTRDVAREFGVTDRTAGRWAAQVRVERANADVGRRAAVAAGLSSGSPETQTPWQGQRLRKDTEGR